jgi:hypothetical protein
MNTYKQMELFAQPEMRAQIRDKITNLVSRHIQPSAIELLQTIEKDFGWAARWEFEAALREINADKMESRATRDYVHGLLESGDIAVALRGGKFSDNETITGIDSLIHASKSYRHSSAFQEMITFMARFRDYAPYNNMLVKVQNPSCSFYAREKDWCDRFGRYLKEDARPMLILAPMHPIMLVYDIDQTEGAPLPEKLTKFANFEGEFDLKWLNRMRENAESYRIRVDIKQLTSTNAGFATMARGTGDWKMRIVLHDELNDTSCFGVLCHELAHILLGHLGADRDLWWPCRSNLTRQTVEIEAESVAYIVTSRLGLKGSSAAYVSGYLKNGPLPESVSLDLIAKVAGTIEKMALGHVPPKKPKQEPNKKRTAQGSA